MARIDRRIRRRGAVNIDQEAYLGIGWDFSGGKMLFENKEHERQVWLKCRESLMAERTRPGSRPFGFYVHDLGLEYAPDTWWEELAVLESRKLLTAEEIVAVENVHRQIDPNQGVHFCSSFEDPEKVRAMRLDVYILRQQVNEFAFCADWHKLRDRPELAARYLRMVDATRAVLEGTK